MQQIFLDLETSDNTSVIQYRLFLREAFALDQFRDEILWRPDGTAKELSEEEKELLDDLKLVSARLIAKVQELKVYA